MYAGRDFPVSLQLFQSTFQLFFQFTNDFSAFAWFLTHEKRQRMLVEYFGKLCSKFHEVRGIQMNVLLPELVQAFRCDAFYVTFVFELSECVAARVARFSSRNALWLLRRGVLKCCTRRRATTNIPIRRDRSVWRGSGADHCPSMIYESANTDTARYIPLARSAADHVGRTSMIDERAS